MDFQLTEEQRILQESARRLAEDKFAPKAFTSSRFPRYALIRGMWSRRPTSAPSGSFPFTDRKN
jgi:hypothetical protein